MSDLMERIERRLKSANSVPVDRTYITAEEWAEVARQLRENLAAQAEIEALRGRVAMMEGAIRATVKAAPAGGPLWFQSDEINALADSVKDSSQAWLKRKQAEAVERMTGQWFEEAEMLPAQHEHKGRGCSTYNWQTHYARLGEAYAQRLRQQADEAEKAGGE